MTLQVIGASEGSGVTGTLAYPSGTQPTDRFVFAGAIRDRVFAWCLEAGAGSSYAYDLPAAGLPSSGPAVAGLVMLRGIDNDPPTYDWFNNSVFGWVNPPAFEGEVYFKSRLTSYAGVSTGFCLALDLNIWGAALSPPAFGPEWDVHVDRLEVSDPYAVRVRMASMHGVSPQVPSSTNTWLSLDDPKPKVWTASQPASRTVM